MQLNIKLGILLNSQLIPLLGLQPKINLSDHKQRWIRGKRNDKDYFTLQNKATRKLLTFATSSETKVAGMNIDTLQRRNQGRIGSYCWMLLRIAWVLLNSNSIMY